MAVIVMKSVLDKNSIISINNEYLLPKPPIESPAITSAV
jgi:hypothetical protein